MKRIIALFIVILIPAVGFAADGAAEKGHYFVDGVAHYNEGDYAAALKSLTIARQTIPSIADYALIYMAKSYVHTGNSEKALEAAKELYDTYPESSLVEEARGIEVVASLQKDQQGSLWLLDKYVHDFPFDVEMKFLLAGLLKESGQTEKAKLLFREIYRAACPLSQDALGELETADITVRDRLERAENLFKLRRYEEAEKDLRDTLKTCDASLKRDVKEKLADSLFRQRKYRESSGLYQEIGDLYNAARSLIRDGQREKFHTAMDKLVASGDPKGANLMLAYAGDLRRSGKTKEALELLEKVQKKYPGVSEDALWSTGWIHYVKGDYAKAQKIFTKLYRKNKSAKYLYWKARVDEKTGRDSSKLYKQLVDDDSFYGVLSRLRTGITRDETDIAGDSTSFKPTPIERIDLLVAAGLRSDAARELLLRAERLRDSQNLRDIALRLMDLQEYRKAMLVTSTIPANMRPFDVQYPLAFWSRVSQEAAANGIDPYLLLSLIREESRFDPSALSPAGAVGLMQLMPETAKLTARNLKIPVKGPESLQDIDLNIKLGTHYLGGLLKQFNSVPAALAAYNAGGSRVKGWLSQNNYGSSDEFIEDIPFEETRNYVKRIVGSYFHYWRARPIEGETVLNIL